MYPFRVLPDGDAALLVALPESIDVAVSAWCVALADAVRREHGGVVRDVVVGFCSVTVYFDPFRTDGLRLERALHARAATIEPGAGLSGSTIEVPVCYGGGFGPDLEGVAAFARCTAEQVVLWHTAVTYRVYLLGFVPGFAYMAGVDPRIAAPRRAIPRTAVPAGSVAVAGRQTGIYPDTTPGGWNLIGRTPLQPFSPARPKPSLFDAGDQVRFRSITADEFDRLSAGHTIASRAGA